MQPALRFMAVLLLLLPMGISGCVSTTLQTDWKDPAFNSKFKKVLVICIVKEMVIRNTLEDNLTAQFRQRGVAAVQSYTLFPALENLDKDVVRAKVREMGADGVFLVRQTGKGVLELSPDNSYDLWNIVWIGNATPQTNTVDFYRVETSLYEAAKGGIVWQALSETYDDDSLRKIVSNFAALMVKKLGEQGLI